MKLPPTNIVSLRTRYGPLVVNDRPQFVMSFAAALNEAVELVASALSLPPTPAEVLELSRQLSALTDRRLAAAWDRARAADIAGPACRAGCSHCCRHFRVHVTAPEVFAIADYLRSGAGQQTADEVLERCRTLPADSRVCPLLLDDRCSVWPVREVISRGYHSLDAQACADSRELGGEVAIVPQCVEASEVGRAILTGTQAALTELGLATPGFRLELHSALRVALAQPNALAAWVTGERVFAEVEVPMAYADRV